MSKNSLGVLFRLSTFGESHGPYVGGIIDGCPAGIPVDYELINRKVKERQTGMFAYSSARKEDDCIEFISGINKGKTTGTPLAFIVKNKDVDISNYQENSEILKPSSATFTYWKKYKNEGFYVNGRASARETIARVIGGCFAMMLLKQQHIHIQAFTTQIGNVSIPKNIDFNAVNSNPLRCPDAETSEQMMKLLHQIASEKDSIGAQVICRVENLPIGLGEPVFDKLNADLSKALMSIPAAKGIEFGIGFDAARMKGSEYNDLYKENFKTHTNHAGGIQAGISNGEILYFSMAFKPIPSIMKDQQSINKQGKKAIYKAGGRHDICVVPRVLSIVEAMTALVLADHLLRNKIN